MSAANEVVSSRAQGVAADSAAVPHTTDEALLERLGTRADTEALSELYDRYQALMYGLAMRITNDTQMAQDAVQEAFVGVWRNAARYSAARASVRTWILSITLEERARNGLEHHVGDERHDEQRINDEQPLVARRIDQPRLALPLRRLTDRCRA